MQEEKDKDLNGFSNYTTVPLEKSFLSDPEVVFPGFLYNTQLQAYVPEFQAIFIHYSLKATFYRSF